MEQRAHELVEEAARKRTEAARVLREASLAVETEFSLRTSSFQQPVGSFRTFSTSSENLGKSGRFEATYHDDTVAWIEARINQLSHKTLGEVVTVIKPGMFKRIKVENAEYGYGFITGSQLFSSDPKPIYYVSPKTPNIDDCVLKSGWVLLQAYGQIGGLIGRTIMTTPSLAGFAATDLQIQLRFEDEAEAGYVQAFLSSEAGYRLIARTPIGGSIPNIRADAIESIVIPWPEASKRKAIGAPVYQAWRDRQRAAELEDEARALVERTIEEAS